MLYHISTYKNIEVLSKCVPKSIPKGKLKTLENVTIERVCFSETIDGCLSAICPSINKNLYVYVPIDSNLKPYKPTLKQVFDSKVTNEMWVMDDVPVKCVGILQTMDIRGKVMHKNYIKVDGFMEYIFNWRWMTL